MSAGCRASPVAPGEQQVDTTSAGAPRFYLRNVPSSYDGKQPVPVVVDLHGRLEGAQLHETNSMLGAFGAQHGFVTITPQGSGAVVPSWDPGFGSPDVRFVGDLLDEVERTLCVDTRRVFVAGYSGGAFLASTLACVDAKRIAAIATVSGLMNPAGCKPARPLPVVAFQGTGDEWVAYTGGLGPRAQAASADDGTGRMLADAPDGKAVARSASTPTVTAAWAKRNGCSAKPTEAAIASDITLVRYRCPNHADVQLYRVAGGGHTWPGSEFSRAIEFAVGPTTFSINADNVIWSFFQAHPRHGT
jgi:polyhydroxybutyrate depolymerase